MQSIYPFFGTAAQPPTPLEVANQNGAPIKSIRVDNYSPAWYNSQTLNVYIPPFTIGWTQLYQPPVGREIIRKGAPAGYVQQALPPNTPTQVVITVADDDSLYQYGAPYGTTLGPKIGSASQPIVEVALFQPSPVTPFQVDLEMVGGVPLVIGQQLMAASLPVVIASNQSTIPVTIGGTVAPIQSATGTTTQVGSNAASVTILAANANRKGASIFNDDANNLFLRLANGGAASNTVYTVRLVQFAYFELPPAAIYTGAITGIWAAAGAGAARVTEYT